MKPIVALICKDLFVHWRGILAAQAGVLLLILLTIIARYGRFESTDDNIGIVFNMNFMMTLLWGDWLISREKLKGTFLWLRTMPLSVGQLVAAKLITYTGIVSLLFGVSVLLFARGYFLWPRLAGLILLWSLLVLFGTTCLACRWRFRQKAGQVVPLLLFGVPLLSFLLAEKSGAVSVAFVREVVRSLHVQIALAAMLLLAAVAFARILVVWLSSVDSIAFRE